MLRSLTRLWAKSWAVVGVVVALSASSPALALGLGDVRLDSALNEPLRAEIELLSATPEELDNLTVQMAAPETYTRYGLDRPAYLQGVRFNIVRSGRTDGNIVRLTSVEPITEPFLTFLVEAAWSRGRLLREYTVLLDPPTFAPPTTAPVTQQVQPPVQTAPADSGQISRPAPQTAPAPSRQTAAHVGPHVAAGIRPSTSTTARRPSPGMQRRVPRAIAQSPLTHGIRITPACEDSSRTLRRTVGGTRVLDCGSALRTAGSPCPRSFTASRGTPTISTRCSRLSRTTTTSCHRYIADPVSAPRWWQSAIAAAARRRGITSSAKLPDSPRPPCSRRIPRRSYPRPVAGRHPPVIPRSSD